MISKALPGRSKSKLIIALLIGGLSFLTLNGNSQGTSKQIVRGQVLDGDGKPVPFATISVENTTNGTTSDADGHFALTINDKKAVSIICRCIGYEEALISLKNDKQANNNITIQLNESIASIDEVMVVEKSGITKINELPYTITAIDTKPLQTRNLDVNGILGTVTGVKIREKGGMGSGFVFSLNGFTGNQVKFFIDGIPMDNFGSSLTLNNIPVNLISSFEVYKGVIPIELGTDALGGAVNIVTNQNTNSFLDVAYSAGSFNTHRVSVISRHTFPKTGIQLNANAFYNYSDNDYKIWVEVADADGSVGDPVKVTRFHDAYNSLSGQVEIGVVGKRYADRLFLSVMGSTNYKEWQTGYNLSKIAGQVYTTSERIIMSLKYKKEDLLVKNLDARLYATYLKGEDLKVDTSSREYDWYGNYTVKAITATSGELNWYKTLFRFNDKSFMNSAYLSYQLWPGHSIALNNTHIYFNRVGDDPIGYYSVPFSDPNIITKNITGLSYSHNLFGGKLKSSFFAKCFYMDANMYDLADSDSDEETVAVNNKFIKGGAGVATSYFILSDLQAKLSFENTYRLPETEELFGDGLTLLPNPNLIPEHSTNFNIGLAWNKVITRNQFSVETNYLYRLPSDLIKLVSSGTRAWYENYTDAKINCYEMDLKYSYNNKFRINLNGTYQDIKDNKLYTSTGGTNYLYGDRIPNIPYLFGNASAGYQFSPFKDGSTKVSVDWNTQYVEEFYLKSPSLGNLTSKYVIPRQVSHNLSLSFLFDDGKYNLSLACTNLTDNELYDNYKLQKPGRAFSAKLRYYLAN